MAAAGPEAPRDVSKIDAIPIDRSFLSIPDEQNEAIVDARKTFLVTVVSAIVFITIVFVFIL
jgi:hypothetical protein